MSRNRHETGDTPGQDSFLDILANITGILIILVMVMGVRAGRAPLDTVAEASPEDQQQLHNALAAEQSLREEVLEMSNEAARLEQEALARGKYRHVLAATKIEMEQALADRRKQLDADRQAAFDLQQKLSEAQGTLDTLNRQRAAAETAEPETVVIESYPTPISRTVHGDEAHFQIRNGGVTRVPMKALLDRLEGELEQKKERLRDSAVYTDTVGPIGGFRMRYTFRRREIRQETGYGVAHVATVVELALAEFLPLSDDPAESIDEALGAGSEFRSVLSQLRPGRTTVTLWIYPHEFDAFRRLRKELYHLGFAVAARPLPRDVPISASPDGTRSAAQ